MLGGLPFFTHGRVRSFLFWLFFFLLLVSREAILLPWGQSALWVKQLAEQQEMAWQTAEAPAASAEVWPLPLQQHGCDADLALARNALHGLWCN